MSSNSLEIGIFDDYTEDQRKDLLNGVALMNKLIKQSTSNVIGKLRKYSKGIIKIIGADGNLRFIMKFDITKPFYGDLRLEMMIRENITGSEELVTMDCTYKTCDELQSDLNYIESCIYPNA